MGGGCGRRGLPLHREAREGRAPDAQGWPCFGAGEGGECRPPATLALPHPRPIPRAARGTGCRADNTGVICTASIATSCRSSPA